MRRKAVNKLHPVLNNLPTWCLRYNSTNDPALAAHREASAVLPMSTIMGPVWGVDFVTSILLEMEVLLCNSSGQPYLRRDRERRNLGLGKEYPSD